MSLLTLPPELLAIIIGKLDTKSVCNLYVAGVHCIQGLVTQCHLSANALATAKTLKTDFFIGVSGYLKVLNLSGIQDLSLSCLLEALTNMKSLIDLDVSYTNIIMSDFLEIAAATPTLKSIAINFTFVKSKEYHITDEVLFRIKKTELPKYQQIFKRFKNVHFVGQMHARVHGRLALLMLARAELHNLTFSTVGAVEGSRLDVTSWNVVMVNAAQFQLYFLKIPRRRALFETPICTVMDVRKYEVIIFCIYYKYCDLNGIEIQKVFATPELKKIVCEHYGVEIESLSAPLSHAELSTELVSSRFGHGKSFACFFWDVVRTKFDSAFRSKLLKKFKEYYVFNVDASETPVPADHDWCRVIADSQRTLNYSTKFQKKERVKLKIYFNNKFDIKTKNAIPKIYEDRDFLKKITHLTLSGDVPGDPTYFQDLFESCRSLKTLELALERHDSKVTFLQHLKGAKCLRNFLLYLYPPEQLFPLLTYLSECESLQNIYLFTTSAPSVELVPNWIPLLSKFCNLYNLCINVALTATEAKVDEMCRRVTSVMGRDALRISLSRGYSSYHPYLNVFSLVFQLHPTL